MEEKAFLELRNITKFYGNLKANDGIYLNLRRGEIHALLGENGAGKSTLVKILYGYTSQDKGEILMDGKIVKISNPAHARKIGIEMVFQHFSLFETLSIVENISLAFDEKLNLKSTAEQVQAISEKYGFRINLHQPVIDLSVGERQKVEIIRCLMQNPSLLIMDEPTSVLTPQECSELFATLRFMAKENRSILFISHKLEEIQALCSRATIIRQGKYIAECNPQKEDKKHIVELMIGKQLRHVKKKSYEATSQNSIEIHNLNLSSKGPYDFGLKNIQLSLKKGEILGIAGISGNGQHRLCSVLSGEETTNNADEILLEQYPIGKEDITKKRKKGVVFIPEERLDRGAVAEMNLIENTLLTTYYRKENYKNGFIDLKNLEKEVDSIIQNFDVKTQGNKVEAGSLSGGNLQKFILGREIRQNPKVLIVATPTWGIDANAELYVRQAILDIATRGTTVILFSQDLSEIFALSDKIAVLFEGKLSKTYPANEINEEQIGLLMVGEADV